MSQQDHYAFLAPQGLWACPQMPAPDVLRRVLVGPSNPAIRQRPHTFQTVEQTFDGDFVAIGTLPVDCDYFTDAPDGAKDTMFLAELIRRGVEIISHALLDIAYEDHFVLKSVYLAVDRGMLSRVEGDAVAVKIVMPKGGFRRRRNGSIYGIDGPFFCLFDDQVIAEYRGTIAFMPPAAYTCLRGGELAPVCGFPQGHVGPVQPLAVGKRQIGNVLIGDVLRSSGGWLATVLPQQRPPFFDRPLDHYPGMYLAEAARQLAVYATHMKWHVTPSRIGVSSVGMEFRSFTELDEPPVLHLSEMKRTRAGSTSTTIITQAGQMRASFAIETAFDNMWGAEA